MTQVPAKAEPSRTPATKPHPFQSLRHEMERIFDDFESGKWLHPFGGPPFDLRNPWLRNGFEYAPPAEVAEKDHDYEITVELPGMDEKNIEVNIAEGVLTIKGEKCEEKKEEKKDYCLSERSYGSFFRSFALPEGVNADKISAKFDKGVLKVSFPKPTSAVEKKIAVKAA